jgi:hypothetical protein
MIEDILLARAEKIKAGLHLDRLEAGELFLRRLADELNGKNMHEAYTNAEFMDYTELIGSSIYGLDIYLSESLKPEAFIIITS